ncbi:MAG: hypothetical protein ABSA83_02000 [Verrucomicrobiota bacterium]|jgi:hypothetical protein
MRISILADSNWEAKVAHAKRPLCIREVFEERDYGSSIQEIIIVLNCRSPELGHKQRVRFSPGKAQLSMDVMLPLDLMVRSTHSERRALIARQLCHDVRIVLSKYSFASFDVDGFFRDFKGLIEEDLLGADADQFDLLCAQQAPKEAN